MKIATKFIHAGAEPDPSTGAIMTPIYQTSTYVQEAPGKNKGFEYARSQNPTRKALEEALDAYQGTIITISHDRYFLDRVATQILALDGEEHAEHYDGDYTEYHDWKAGLAGTTPSKHQDVLLDDRYISTESGGGAEPGEPKLKPAKSGADTGSKRSRKAKSAEQTSTRVKVIKKARSPELIEAA